MQQQINLYQPIFRKEAKLLSAKSMAQIVGAVLVLLVIIAVYFEIQVQSLALSERNSAAQASNLRAQITAVKAQMEDTDLEGLDARIGELEGSIAQRQAMLDSMGMVAGELGNGFATYLTALSRQHLAGLWLTGLTMTSSGEVVVNGVTLEADLLPRYLDLLPRQSALANWHFQDIEVTRKTDDPRFLGFRLQTRTTKAGGLL